MSGPDRPREATPAHADARHFTGRSHPVRVKGPPTRRSFLGLVAGAGVGLAGCSGIGSDRETPTLTPAPVATSTVPGTATATVAPDEVNIALANIERRHSFFYTISHGATAVAARDRQYLFMNVFRRGGSRPRPGELELVAGEGAFPGTTAPAGLAAYADRLAVDRWGAARPDEGVADWVAFGLPAPLRTGRALVRWATADRTLAALPTSVVEALAERPPELSVRSLSLPDRVGPGDPVPFSIRVHNGGTAGLFRGVLSWVDAPETSPMQELVVGEVAAGATTTVDGVFDTAFRFGGDRAAFRLSSNGGTARGSVALGTPTPD